MIHIESALVLNIQRFSLHDGDGVRTTVFFKGCGLHCLWCHNPESQSYKPQLMTYNERCKLCGACVQACPQNALSISNEQLVVNRKDCIACGTCTDYCAYDALEIAGKHYTVAELINELKKDMIIYDESGGGVTLSGGEVMSQSKSFLQTLVQGLNRIGIRVNIDTCGLAPWETYEVVLPYVDTFLYDIKTIDEDLHLETIGPRLDVILDNLIRLNETGAKINIRIPIIGKVNDDTENISEIIDWLKSNNIKVKKVNLLPYHTTGSGKYERLSLDYPGHKMEVPSDEHMNDIKSIFEKNGFTNTFIGG